MLSSLKGDSIVKGIPTYILAITIVVPVLLFSGSTGENPLGEGSFGSGVYDFLERDWRSWSDDEWGIFIEMLEYYGDDDDNLPPFLERFANRLENMNENEQIAFLLELQNRLVEEYGPEYYDDY